MEETARMWHAPKQDADGRSKSSFLQHLQLAGLNGEPGGRAEEWFAEFRPRPHKAEYRRESLELKTIYNVIIVTAMCLVDQAKTIKVIIVSAFYCSSPIHQQHILKVLHPKYILNLPTSLCPGHCYPSPSPPTKPPFSVVDDCNHLPPGISDSLLPEMYSSHSN